MSMSRSRCRPAIPLRPRCRNPIAVVIKVCQALIEDRLAPLPSGREDRRRRRQDELLDPEGTHDDLPERENADDDHPGEDVAQRLAPQQVWLARPYRRSVVEHVGRDRQGILASGCRRPGGADVLAQFLDQRNRVGFIAWCRACAASAGRLRVPAMMRPGLALITSTRSARNTASRRSWVTRITVGRRAIQRSCNASHSSSRVNMSSEANGSSSMSSDGSWISARQSEVRCCMPPDSCQGK